LAIGGAATTVIVAVAWLPEPALLEVTVPVMFTFRPLVVPTTFTEKVQEPPAAIVPPDRFTTEKPEIVPVVIVPEPHDPVRPFGFATASPAGRVSLKLTPESASVALKLVIVKVSDVFPFRGMVLVPNTLAILIGPITVRLMVVVWVSAPEMPVIVIVLVPGAAVLLAVNVTELVEVAGLVL
jgi:hypothetical protein